MFDSSALTSFARRTSIKHGVFLSALKSQRPIGNGSNVFFVGFYVLLICTRFLTRVDRKSYNIDCFVKCKKVCEELIIQYGQKTPVLWFWRRSKWRKKQKFSLRVLY